MPPKQVKKVSGAKESSKLAKPRPIQVEKGKVYPKSIMMLWKTLPP